MMDASKRALMDPATKKPIKVSVSQTIITDRDSVLYN